MTGSSVLHPRAATPPGPPSAYPGWVTGPVAGYSNKVYGHPNHITYQTTYCTRDNRPVVPGSGRHIRHGSGKGMVTPQLPSCAPPPSCLSPMTRVIRSKRFCWMCSRPGEQLRTDTRQTFWAGKPIYVVTIRASYSGTRRPFKRHESVLSFLRRPRKTSTLLVKQVQDLPDLSCWVLKT